MPQTEVRAFRDSNGTVPLEEWLDDLEQTEPKAYAKCLARILELQEKGNEMRRPHADYLRAGICELRAPFRDYQYRLLYFFCGRHVVTLSHGIVKESKVPPEDIELAIRRKAIVNASPEKYTASFEI